MSPQQQGSWQKVSAERYAEIFKDCLQQACKQLTRSVSSDARQLCEEHVRRIREFSEVSWKQDSDQAAFSQPSMPNQFIGGPDLMDLTFVDLQSPEDLRYVDLWFDEIHVVSSIGCDRLQTLSLASLSVGAVALAGAAAIRISPFLSAVASFIGLPTRDIWLASFGFLGLGSALYCYSDVKRGIRRKIARQVNRHLQGRRFVDITTERVAAACHTSLQRASQTAQIRFRLQVERLRAETSALEKICTAACERREFYNGMLGRTRSILDALAVIEV